MDRVKGRKLNLWSKFEVCKAILQFLAPLPHPNRGTDGVSSFNNSLDLEQRNLDSKTQSLDILRA